ncbi:MAG: hypothetical protein U5R48_12605 [Gammaproteobacteria bacterium]|nr:hypothetical protein [Gammaproteobacteria bacterium]
MVETLARSSPSGSAPAHLRPGRWREPLIWPGWAWAHRFVVTGDPVVHAHRDRPGWARPARHPSAARGGVAGPGLAGRPRRRFPGVGRILAGGGAVAGPARLAAEPRGAPRPAGGRGPGKAQ